LYLEAVFFSLRVKLAIRKEFKIYDGNQDLQIVYTSRLFQLLFRLESEEAA
jgi:hypothetical protein